MYLRTGENIKLLFNCSISALTLFSIYTHLLGRGAIRLCLVGASNMWIWTSCCQERHGDGHHGFILMANFPQMITGKALLCPGYETLIINPRFEAYRKSRESCEKGDSADANLKSCRKVLANLTKRGIFILKLTRDSPSLQILAQFLSESF